MCVLLRFCLYCCVYCVCTFLECTPIVPLYDYSFNLGTSVHFVTVLIQGLMIIIIFLRACSNFYLKKRIYSLSKQSVYEHLWWPLPLFIRFSLKNCRPFRKHAFSNKVLFFSVAFYTLLLCIQSFCSHLPWMYSYNTEHSVQGYPFCHHLQIKA